MKITIESTSLVTTLVHEPGEMPARVWEGTTESGIPVHVYVTRIAVDRTEDVRQFEAELLECRPPSADLAAAIPLRMIL